VTIRSLYHFCQDENGQDLVEYSLILTFVALACLTVYGSLEPATNAIWVKANTEVVTANTFASGS